MTRNVRTLLVAIFAAYWVQIAVLILAPLKAVELGYPAWAAAALAALWGLLAVVLDLPASAISDQLGRRRMVMGGGLLMATSAMALAIAGDYLGLAAGIVLFSLGQALTIGPMLAFLTETAEPAAHHRVQGINGFVQGVSSVMAALAAGVLAQIDFFIAFVPLVIASGAVAIAAATTSESTMRRATPDGKSRVLSAHLRALRMARSRPAVGFATLGVVLFAVVFTVVASTILPVVLVDFEGYEVALVGVLLAFRNLTSAGVALSFAPVTRRWGVPPAMLRTGVIGVIGTALFAVTTGEPLLLLIALAIQGVGVAYSAPGANVLVTSATDTNERAVGISALTVASRATVLVVPLALAPFLSAAFGGTVFLIAAVVAAAILWAMLHISRRLPEPAEDADRFAAPPTVEAAASAGQSAS